MRCLGIAQRAGLYHLPRGYTIMHIALCSVLLAPATVQLLWYGIRYNHWCWGDLAYYTTVHCLVFNILQS